jgi:hypothetical protein
MNMKLKTCVALLAATVTTAANAGIVTKWTYSNQAGFNAWTGTNLTATTADDPTGSGNSSTGGNDPLTDDANNILITGNNVDADAYQDALNTHLEWGTPYTGPGGGKSALDIDSPVNGTIETFDSAWAAGTDITHQNWLLRAGSDSLTFASVLDGLSLTPMEWDTEPAPAFSTMLAPQLQFGIDFYETPNNTDLDVTCPDGVANGVGNNLSGSGKKMCGDIFEITGLELLPFAPVVGPDFIEFTVPFFLNTGDDAWDSVQYLVTTRLSGLTTLPATYTCANAAPACFGFVTREEKDNVLSAQFKIGVATVPEPAAIALFGLGLFATGIASRRRKVK